MGCVVSYVSVLLLCFFYIYLLMVNNWSIVGALRISGEFFILNEHLMKTLADGMYRKCNNKCNNIFLETVNSYTNYNLFFHSSATDMNGMFNGASSFNGDLSGWNVG